MILILSVLSFIEICLEITFFFVIVRLIVRFIPLWPITAFEGIGAPLIDGIIWCIDSSFPNTRLQNIRPWVKLSVCSIILVFLQSIVLGIIAGAR